MPASSPGLSATLVLPREKWGEKRNRQPWPNAEGRRVRRWPLLCPVGTGKQKCLLLKIAAAPPGVPEREGGEEEGKLVLL